MVMLSRRSAATPVVSPAPAPSATRQRLVVGLALVATLAPAGLALARYPSWWAWIAPEQTPMTWLQSVVLVVTAVGALLASHVVPPQHPAASGGRSAARTWLLLALGLAALAADERFALHERVRDSLLAPRDVRLPFLPWVGPGDFLLIGVAIVGLALLPRVWRLVRPDPAAAAALLLGVVLAALAVAADSVDPATWSLAAERVEQSAEEVVELWSGLCLLAAVWLRALGMLDAASATSPPVAATP